MRRNLATSLRRRSRAGSMEGFDTLPADLRRWLSRAALPWSPRSALRLWTRLLRETGGDRAAVLRRMDRAETRMLNRDCPKVWGRAYPLDPLPGRDGDRAPRRGS